MKVKKNPTSLKLVGGLPVQKDFAMSNENHECSTDLNVYYVERQIFLIKIILHTGLYDNLHDG